MSTSTISLYRNADQSLLLHFTNADGTDVDLTGKTVWLYVAKGVSSTPYLFDPIQVASHTDPTHGQTAIALTANDTNHTAKGYRYEIWLDNTPSDIGTLTIKETLRV